MNKTFASLIIDGMSRLVEEDAVSIGRGVDNLIVVDDPSVSVHHAVIEASDDVWVLRDLGSTNGTKVNGQPVTEAELKNGDVICFGAVEAAFVAMPRTAEASSVNNVPQSAPPPVEELKAAAESPAPSLGAKLASLGNAAWQETKRNSQIISLKAQIEKLTRIDLRQAFQDLGRKCYEQKVREEELASHFQEIRALEQRIEEKGKGVQAEDGVKTLDSLRAAALNQASKAAAEALGLKLGGLFVEVGKAAAQLTDTTALPEQELSRVREVEAKIAELGTACAGLSANEDSQTKERAKFRNQPAKKSPWQRVGTPARFVVGLFVCCSMGTVGWWLLSKRPIWPRFRSVETKGRYAEYPLIGEQTAAALKRFNITRGTVKVVEETGAEREQQFIIAKFTPSPAHVINVRIKDGYVIGFVYVSDDKSHGHAEAIARDIKAVYTANAIAQGKSISLPGTEGDTLEVVSFSEGTVIACASQFSGRFYKSYEMNGQNAGTGENGKRSTDQIAQPASGGSSGKTTKPSLLVTNVPPSPPGMLQRKAGAQWVGTVVGSALLGAKTFSFGRSRSELGRPDDDTYYFFQSDKLIGVTRRWSLDGRGYDELWDNVMNNFSEGNVFERRQYKLSGVAYAEAWIGFKDAIVILIGNKTTGDAWRPPPDGIQAHVIGFDYIRGGLEPPLDSILTAVVSIVRTNKASGVEVARFGEKIVVTNKHIPGKVIDLWSESRRKEGRVSSEIQSEAAGIAKAENDLRQRALADCLQSELNADKRDPYRNPDTGDYELKLQDGTLINVSSANQVVITKPPTL